MPRLFQRLQSARGIARSHRIENQELVFTLFPKRTALLLFIALLVFLHFLKALKRILFGVSWFVLFYLSHVDLSPPFPLQIESPKCLEPLSHTKYLRWTIKDTAKQAPQLTIMNLNRGQRRAK